MSHPAIAVPLKRFGLIFSALQVKDSKPDMPEMAVARFGDESPRIVGAAMPYLSQALLQVESPPGRRGDGGEAAH
jgi:hypothetical protein